MFAESALAAMPELTLPDFIRSNALFEATHNFGYLKPVFERAFIEQHALRFDENLRIGEDYVFLASALALGARCVIEPIPGYNYNIREGSISRVLELRHIEAMVEGDRVFLGKHTLDADAMAAQKFRARSLRQATSFLILMENIEEQINLRRDQGGMARSCCPSPPQDADRRTPQQSGGGIPQSRRTQDRHSNVRRRTAFAQRMSS